MSFIKTTPPGEATGVVRTMYERQQASYGYVPNYARVFSHRPELMAHWAGLLAGIRRYVNQSDARRFELVTLAAAHALRNSYCTLAHGVALTEFFSTDELRGIASEEDSGPLSKTEVAVMSFARKVARDASRVTAGDAAVLKEHGLADEEIFDVVATVAARAFFTRLLDGLGVEPDAAYLELDEGLRKSLTIGRPISAIGMERVGMEDPSVPRGGSV